MTQRVLEAQKWQGDWETNCRAQGRTPDELASLLFVAAALLRHEQGKNLMEMCVDAHRKLGCSHAELSFVLGNSAQRLNMVEIGRSRW